MFMGRMGIYMDGLQSHNLIESLKVRQIETHGLVRNLWWKVADT